jgi:hypothetical protein
VDTLFYQLGNDGDPVHYHDTKVGERWVDYYSEEIFDHVGNWRTYRHVKDFLDQGYDPPQVVIEHGHRAGLEVFLSLRINDCHDGLPNGALLSQFKKDQPEYWLGERPGFHRLLRTGLNFVHPEVRQRRLAIIEEACERYTPDGFELDFQRHPFFFREDEAPRNSYIMTDFVRKVWSILDRTAKRSGRTMPLAVRVPPSFALCRKVGLDVENWLSDGLIHVLTAGSTVGQPLNLPVEEFVEATRGTKCQVFANMGPAVPWQSDFKFLTDEIWRATALNYWRAGVDGLYLWNVHHIPHYNDPRWNYGPIREIGEPDLIAHLDKRYIVDHSTYDYQVGGDGGIGPYGAYVLPPAQLPLALVETDSDSSAEIRFKVADHLQPAGGQGILESATLKIRLRNYTNQDRLAFKLNGERLPAPQPILDLPHWEHHRIEFDLISYAIRQGENCLQIHVMKRNPQLRCTLVLTDVEILVKYHT